jgi:hypothetical protein
LRAKQAEKENAETEILQLEQQRRTLLEEYFEGWRAIRQRRLEIVALIDSNSADNIKAELLEEVEKDEYRTLLDDIADRLTSATNRISRRQDQLGIIAASVNPEQLIEVVRSGDSNRLTELAPDVTPNTARVMLGMGEADIHLLETCVLHDRFVISYRREGDADYTPVDSGLSGGEQALALISVAMVPKELPLVIDQPEDELGPALITFELVEQIRLVKPVRQMIFVTHVPNIPVLADSEQIIYVEQEINDGNKSCVVKHCGSLENRNIVSNLLELDGGDMAFQKRSERYSSVLG